jgi:hypothetical protein
VRVLVILVIVSCAGHRPEPPSSCTATAEPAKEYQKRWGGLSVRDGDNIVEASVADQTVAKSYPTWPAKGVAVDGVALTIMTAKTTYAVGEEVRVIHVLDVGVPGRDVYVMGPKVPNDEFVDGARTTPPPEIAEYPWVGSYDGVVLPSPAIDFNYDVTSYRFATAGTHVIEWRLGGRRSNTITLAVR